jgi:hypothetical protein
MREENGLVMLPPDAVPARIAARELHKTGGSFCGSLMCHTSAAKSWRRSVTRNRNRIPNVQHSHAVLLNLVSDPIGSGFAANLAHPGGNITACAPDVSTRANRAPLSSSELSNRSTPTSASQNPQRNPHSARGTPAAHFPRFRALALFGRRPPCRVLRPSSRAE